MARPTHRGTTILETMVALAVMLAGAIGTLTLHVQQLRMNADARRMTEAVAVARDMVENIATWPYSETDPRLENTQTANDTDIADDAFTFEGSSPVYDHGEADLGATWNGLSTAAVTRLGFERYWNVAYPDDAESNGIKDAVRIAVIVRWRSEVGWRRVVLLTTKLNPAEAQ